MDNNSKILYSTWIETVLGPIYAVGDDKHLYLLEFREKRRFENEIAKLKSQFNAEIRSGVTAPLHSITEELDAYFDGSLQEFKTPIHLMGTDFQKIVWEELMRIPYAKTRSYGAQAAAIKKPTAYRAVANANGANQLSIIIPCHRIINTNGLLGGYGGGIERKQWLIDHERKHAPCLG